MNQWTAGKITLTAFLLSLFVYVFVGVGVSRMYGTPISLVGVSDKRPPHSMADVDDVHLLRDLMRNEAPSGAVLKLDQSTITRLSALTARLVGRSTTPSANEAGVERGGRHARLVLDALGPHPQAEADPGETLNLDTINTDTRHSSLDTFHVNIRRHRLYSPAISCLNHLHEDMLNQPVVRVREQLGGTQLKLSLTTAENGMLLWKPARFGRDVETKPDHFYFSDFERFNAEIAAYHLDRILEFYRTPPSIGRDFNITKSFLPHAQKSLLKTFFVSPAGNVCFHGSCKVYCETGHSVCGRPEFIEGSVSAYLPPMTLAKRTTHQHPWRRTYSKHRQETWPTDKDYCAKVRGQPMYSKGRALMDLVDMAIFDFLTGNMDRHHYETFLKFGNDTFPIHLDNGKGFGRSSKDEISILAPLTQCCQVRASTARRLANFATPRTPTLAQRMRASLSTDSLPDLLNSPHLQALDRRLHIILGEVVKCMKVHTSNVFVEDGH